MHRKFRKELEGATGVSEFVIVLVADIRGFSAFSQTVESTDLAMFIKRVYLKMIDEYFTDARFYKPTGDGLLVIIPFDENSLVEVANKAVETSLRLVSEFPHLCDDDPMINYAVPEQLGIGLTRGSASRLEHGDLVLDYSGRVLNLASRLNDLARPEGVVFDKAFAQGVVRDEFISQFSTEDVYIRSVAEQKPISVCFTTELTKITDRARQPFGDTLWEVQTVSHSRREFRKFSPTYLVRLNSRPRDPSSLKVRLESPTVDRRGQQVKGVTRYRPFKNWKYFEDAGEPYVSLDINALDIELENDRVKNAWPVRIRILFEKKR